MPESQSPSRESANRIGQHLKEGFSNYTSHWQEWMPPILVAGAVVIASFLCCWLPYFFVVGPITCGLYGCAISAIRNGPVDLARLTAGWRSAGSSIIAWLFISLGSMLPMIVVVGCLIATAVVLGSQMPPPQATPGAALRQETADLPGGAADGQGPAGPQAGPCQEEPSVLAVVGMLFAMLVFYGVMFVGIFVGWLWALWFTTRTMFVLPLIADRRLGFVRALGRSWTETRHRFWELLLLKFIADIIGMIGIYAMYVGLLFTLPLHFTLIASVYEERFASPEEPAIG
jgi:hypothetical protein